MGSTGGTPARHGDRCLLDRGLTLRQTGINAWVLSGFLLPVLAMEVAVVPDILTLRAQLCEVERRANIAEAEAANAKAANADLLARNALLELQIEIDET
jgi:hypothetical protein